MSRKQKVLEMLAEGPATASELGAEMGEAARVGVSQVLYELRLLGVVTFRRIDAVPYTGRGPRKVRLWSLVA